MKFFSASLLATMAFGVKIKLQESELLQMEDMLLEATTELDID